MSEDEMIIETVESDTICGVCQAEFLDADDLVIHITQVHPENLTSAGVLTSPLPAQVSESEKILKVSESEHISTAQKPTLQQCLFCYVTFASMEDYAVHLRDSHITSIKCCKFCTKAFIDFNLLKNHENKHKTFKDTAYNCSQCFKKFENVYLLEQHELKFHNNFEDGILLNNYFSILGTVLNMKAPKLLQSLGTNSVYMCVVCNKTTVDIQDYLNHLRTKKCRSISCDKCYNVYQNKKGLSRHIIAHKQCYNYVKNTDLLKPCKNCGVEFDVLNLVNHMKHCQPIRCNICNTIWRTVAELSDHRVTAHPMAIALQYCKFCKKEYVGTVALEKHIERVHKPDMHLYKYMCVHCDNMYFKHPKNLFVHYSSKHASLEPYFCKICNKYYKIRKKFTLHIKLDHKSVGFVEFDNNYNVFFTDKKSANPFVPKSLFVAEHDNGSKIQNLKEEIVTDDPTDCPTDATTDLPTDSETDKAKPPKLRFKKNKATTEMNKISKNAIAKTNSNLKRKSSRAENLRLLQKSDEDSDEEPLLMKKKRENLRIHSKKSLLRHRRNIKNSRMRFTCNICSQYCYTFNNYHHHISLHFKEESKKCVKCSKEYRTKLELKNHMSKEHKSSQLTDTLKSLLERRKKGINNELTTSEKFRRTIKRVKYTPLPVAAKITEVEEKSVKSFIESFTPEVENSKKPIEVSVDVTMKILNTPIYKPSVIKMTKFIPKPQEFDSKLAMPVKFKAGPKETHKISVKLIHTPMVMTYEDDKTDHNEQVDETYFDYDDEIEKDRVPEMAEEVMLEGTEENSSLDTPLITVTANTPYKIAIPDSKAPYYKDIRIAHMLPKAPFFKIVKVKDLIPLEEESNKEPRKVPEKIKKEIELPSGTKLVTVNPLAHLLGDKTVADLVPNRICKYKPKMENVEEAVRKAMIKLEKPASPKASKKTKKPVDVEQ